MESDHNSRRIVRIVVYAMLVLSAACAFLAGDRLWAAAKVGDLPLWAPLLAPIAFTAFVLVYAVDRGLLVRRDGYPVVRAFFQVGFAIVFLSLLWPHQASELREARSGLAQGDAALRMLDSPNADVRALVCELLGLRGDRGTRAQVERHTREDPSAQVRRACSEALAHLGPPTLQKPPR